MIFTHIPCIVPELKMKVHNKRRLYKTPEGNLYPSVTTVTKIMSKEGIDEWKKRVGKGAANEVQIRSTGIGTEFHNIIEDYLYNRVLVAYENIIPLAHFNNVKDILDKIDNIRCQEATLYSDDLKLGGRVDCVAEFEGVNSIIDFKTARKQKKEEWIEAYFVQETAYSLMFEFNTKLQHKQIVTIISGEDGSKDVFVKQRDDYVKKLKEVIKEYGTSIKT